MIGQISTSTEREKIQPKSSTTFSIQPNPEVTSWPNQFVVYRAVKLSTSGKSTSIPHDLAIYNVAKTRVQSSRTE